MKITTHLLARLGVLPLLVILSVGSASAQTNLGKTIVEKLTAKITKLENTCACDIKKYCKHRHAGRGAHDLLHASPRGQDQPEMCVRTRGDCGKRAGDVGPSERRRNCLQSGDNRRVWENTAGPGSNRRMSDREQIDGLEGLRRRHPEGRSYGGSIGYGGATEARTSDLEISEISEISEITSDISENFEESDAVLYPICHCCFLFEQDSTGKFCRCNR